jgi:hypothetical protein
MTKTPRETARHGEVQPQACCRENMRAPGEKKETMRPKAAMPEGETEASTTR